MKNIAKKSCLSKKSGSVLVFSLFVMMMSLIIGMSLMATSSVERRSTLSSAKSINSYQIADSGIEYAYREIREFRWDERGGADGDRDLEDENTDGLDDAFGGDCDDSTGKVSGSVNGGNFELFFYDSASSITPITTCNGNPANIVRIRKIKAIGEYNNIIRSVEAEVDFSNL